MTRAQVIEKLNDILKFIDGADELNIGIVDGEDKVLKRIKILDEDEVDELREVLDFAKADMYTLQDVINSLDGVEVE